MRIYMRICMLLWMQLIKIFVPYNGTDIPYFGTCIPYNGTDVPNNGTNILNHSSCSVLTATKHRYVNYYAKGVQL